MLRVLDRFRRGRSGNVAVIFGLALVPITGLVGAALDYTSANRIRTALMAAADAATIGSIANASAGFNAAAHMAGNGAVPPGVAEALRIFKGELAGRTGFTLTSVTATVTKTNASVTSTVQFSAQVPTAIMKILRMPTITVTGTATASNDVPTFIDFYLLLD